MKYYKQSNDRLTCLLCQHYCMLKENQIGICGINKNIGDTIECLAYGYPKALNIDPIEKKPLYHFLPSTFSLSLGTNGCNFKCPFCQNWQLSQTKTIKKDRYFSPDDIVNLAIKNRSDSISYTYNEPTIFYPYAKDIALRAKTKGLKNVFVSNGFESTEVINDMKNLIDGINVDLKSFNPTYYKKSLGGDLDKLLENLILIYKNTIHLEITTLLVPTKNDSKDELKQIASFIANNLSPDVVWHISAFHPDFKELTLPRTSIESLKMAYNIGKEQGLRYIYIGNAGIQNNTYCPNCNELLINRQYFNTLENNIQDSKCPKCQTKIYGVWR